MKRTGLKSDLSAFHFLLKAGRDGHGGVGHGVMFLCHHMRHATASDRSPGAAGSPPAVRSRKAVPVRAAWLGVPRRRRERDDACLYSRPSSAVPKLHDRKFSAADAEPVLMADSQRDSDIGIGLFDFVYFYAALDDQPSGFALTRHQAGTGEEDQV